MNGVRVPIRFGRWKPVLVAVGLTPRGSYLEIGVEQVRVRMGWSVTRHAQFRTEFSRTSIRSLRRVRDSLSIGLHGWRGRWLVNGAAGPLLALKLDPPARARVFGVPIRLRELIVSVDDPDALKAELNSRYATPPRQAIAPQFVEEQEPSYRLRDAAPGPAGDARPGRRTVLVTDL